MIVGLNVGDARYLPEATWQTVVSFTKVETLEVGQGWAMPERQREQIWTQ